MRRSRACCSLRRDAPVRPRFCTHRHENRHKLFKQPVPVWTSLELCLVVYLKHRVVGCLSLSFITLKKVSHTLFLRTQQHTSRGYHEIYLFFFSFFVELEIFRRIVTKSHPFLAHRGCRARPHVFSPSRYASCCNIPWFPLSIDPCELAWISVQFWRHDIRRP